MVIILVALTLIVAFLAEVLLRHLALRRGVSMARCAKGRRTLSPVAVVPGPGRALQFPKDVYYHTGHAWAKLEEGNRVRIGIDDFTQQVMGDIEDIETPSIGTRLNQGEVAWKLRHGKRKLSQLAPLGGTVVDLNEKLVKDPSMANQSPYEKGWILKIQPKAFSEEMPELMDSFQFQVHFDRLKAKLRSSFNDPSIGMVYGDGGEVIKGAGGILEDRLWKILVTQLFHSSPE
jgi:glycine cleavage system H protein